MKTLFPAAVAIAAAVLVGGCSTVKMSEKGSLSGIDVRGADGKADRTLCVGNEGCFLFNTIPLISGDMDWNAKKKGIDTWALSVFKNETTVQRLTDAFYRYAESENCDVVDVVVDDRTQYPVGIMDFEKYIFMSHELYVTGVLKPRK